MDVSSVWSSTSSSLAEFHVGSPIIDDCPPADVLALMSWRYIFIPVLQKKENFYNSILKVTVFGLIKIIIVTMITEFLSVF